MKSLDILSANGAELSTEQMDNVDGGHPAVLIAGLYFLIGFYIGKNL